MLLLWHLRKLGDGGPDRCLLLRADRRQAHVGDIRCGGDDGIRTQSVTDFDEVSVFVPYRARRDGNPMWQRL